MTYEVKILPVALQDINEGAQWYNEQKQGLGTLFYKAVKFGVIHSSRSPDLL